MYVQELYSFPSISQCGDNIQLHNLGSSGKHILADIEWPLIQSFL